LIGFELANVCLVKGRRRPEQKAALAEAFRFRHRLAVEEVAIDHDDSLALAAATGLTAYDASYLWLAQKMGAELVTLDRGLASASERSVS
jgi:predicted nucleic acid-binding protein